MEFLSPLLPNISLPVVEKSLQEDFMDLQNDLLEIPFYKYFILEDPPVLKPKKNEAITSFISKKTFPGINAKPKKLEDKRISKLINLLEEVGLLNPDDSNSSDITTKFSLEVFEQKIEELKERKHEYFNLFKKLINEGKKKTENSEKAIPKSQSETSLAVKTTDLKPAVESSTSSPVMDKKTSPVISGPIFSNSNLGSANSVNQPSSAEESLPPFEHRRKPPPVSRPKLPVHRPPYPAPINRPPMPPHYADRRHPTMSFRQEDYRLPSADYRQRPVYYPPPVRPPYPNPRYYQPYRPFSHYPPEYRRKEGNRSPHLHARDDHSFREHYEAMHPRQERKLHIETNNIGYSSAQGSANSERGRYTPISPHMRSRYPPQFSQSKTDR